tara:strand:- start:1119 stop:3584 length:2466 start_codon:yes stop_codon:yes gene_type:complete
MADCLKVVDTANKGRLSDDQLEEILAELQAEKKTRKVSGALENIESAIFDRGLLIAKEAEIAKKIEKRNRYMNILKEQKLMALVQRADEMTGDPSLGLEAALVGVNAPFEGASRSVDSITGALVNSYAGGMIADLRKGGLLAKFNNMKGDFERQVANVLGDLNLKTPVGVAEASADAKALGKILFKYQRAAIQRENQAGSYIRLKEGRVVRASHDQRRMVKAGPDAWKNYIRDKLDYSKMGIAPERVEGFLDSSYEAIISGVRKGGERTEISRAFKGPGNLAKKESASGVFTFKKPNDWYDYDQQFGKASLREAFMQDIQSSLRATALMEVLGTNPEAMVARVQKRLETTYRGDAKKLKRIKRESAAVTFDAALAEVTGDVNIGSHTPLARYMHFYRSIQTMAKLGGAWVSALSDVAFIASNRIYQGQSLLGAWGDGFSAVFKGMNKGEMRDFADRLGVGIEGQLGDFMSRFNAADDVAGQTSKMMATFFKLNLLQPWTESNKRGVTLMIANDLGREAVNGFSKLPNDLKRILSIYGIDQKGWDLARKGAKKGPDGRMYLVPGEIPDLKTRENMFALMVSEADNSVPSPGARERAIIRRGYRPGTFAGEGIRFLTQFKSFGVTALTKNVGRHMYGYGAKSMREQLQRGVGANMGIINSIVGTTLLGYYVMQLKEVAKGRDMRPASKETLLAAMLQGGGLGIYGDFLFGEANRFGGGTLETIAGPGIGTAAEVVDLLQRTRGVVTGGEEDLRGDTLRLLKGNIPFANLFYTKEAMNYLIWYQLQETINPGYLRRMERRAKKENDQTYWLPPTSIIQTGGGFR